MNGRKIVEYCLAGNAVFIVKLLQEDWELWGAPFALDKTLFPGGFAQAMVKYEEPK